MKSSSLNYYQSAICLPTTSNSVAQGKKLFEYQVEGFQEKNFTAPKKKVLLKRLVQASDLLKAKPNSFAYNKEGRIIAWEPLTTDAQPESIVDSRSVDEYHGPDDRRPLPLQITFKREIPLDDFVNYAAGANASYQDNSTKQALDLLISQEVARAADNSPNVFKICDNKFFLATPQHDLKNWRMVALSGFSNNVKAGSGKLLLNVNNAFSAFYEPAEVSKYFEYFDSIGHSISRNDLKGEKARKHLIGKRVRIM